MKILIIIIAGGLLALLALGGGALFGSTNQEDGSQAVSFTDTADSGQHDGPFVCTSLFTKGSDRAELVGYYSQYASFTRFVFANGETTNFITNYRNEMQYSWRSTIGNPREYKAAVFATAKNSEPIEKRWQDDLRIVYGGRNDESSVNVNRSIGAKILGLNESWSSANFNYECGKLADMSVFEPPAYVKFYNPYDKTYYPAQ